MPEQQVWFRSPEIITHIFSFLEKRGRDGLAAAARVNTTWFACALRLLWSDPTDKALDQIVLMKDVERQQFYVEQINLMLLDQIGQSKLHEAAKNLVFHQLRSLSIRHPPPSQQIRPFWGSHLDSIDFFSCNIDDGLLQRIGIECLSLNKFSIGQPGPGVTASGFYTFITKCRLLQRMAFHDGTEHLVTGDVLLHLARHSRLSRLHTAVECSSHALQRIRAEVETSFAELQELGIMIGADTVPILVSVFAKVKTLILVLTNSGNYVMRPLSRLKNLESLELTYGAATNIDRQELLSLSQPGKLRSLAVNSEIPSESSPGPIPLESGLSDEDFEEMVSSLPDLHTLELSINLDLLSPASLDALSRHCPLIALFIIPTSSFSLEQLHLADRLQPMFPNLESLNI